MKTDWLRTPELLRLFEALGAPAVDARVVGGAVRNAVMGLPVGEIDAATPEDPDAVTRRLAAFGVRAIPTGLDHGTVTVLIGTTTFEVTTLRRDTACDGRHAAVEFTTDWQEDARRRDFTFNAMSVRPDGALFDYFGGAEDAAAGRVRFVGAPGDRIQEDYLRILRLFRFFAWYGRGGLDAETLKACRAHAAGLARLSAERVQAELVKIFAARDPAPVLALMRDCGVLAAVLPEAQDLARLAALPRIESECAVAPDWRLRLAACLDVTRSETVALRLKMSAADRARLMRLTVPDPAIDAKTAPADVRAALYRHGSDVVRDRLLLAWAEAASETGADDRWRAQMHHVAAWRPRTLPVSGTDVLALGIPQSRVVGEILADVEAWWIAHDFAPSREEALHELTRRVRRENT